MRFLRFTTEPQKDLEKNVSFHYCDFKTIDYTIEEIAEKFSCDVEDIDVIANYYVQKLNGLCGYKLLSETLEDSIIEAKEYINNSTYSGDNYLVIYEGKYTDQTFSIDGDLFEATEILYEEKL